MLIRLLIAPFGSPWKLKCACQSNTNPAWVRRIAIALYKLYQYENVSSIAWNASFAGEPCFPHGMKSIFVSGAAQVGRNCVIFQQVTIGSVTLPASKGAGAPVIGHNVYIGAGAKIVGRVRVGNNVRIGANAVDYSDVPDNCVVVSGEQRNVVKDEAPDNRFYTFRGKWMYFEDGKYVEVLDRDVLASLIGLAK